VSLCACPTRVPIFQHVAVRSVACLHLLGYKRDERPNGPIPRQHSLCLPPKFILLRRPLVFPISVTACMAIRESRSLKPVTKILQLKAVNQVFGERHGVISRICSSLSSPAYFFVIGLLPRRHSSYTRRRVIRFLRSVMA
jgi:hypothetical protein